MSVKYAVAEDAENPWKASVMLWAEAPGLVRTTTIVPSVFLNAPMATPEIVPEVETRYAPGRIKRDHMANAQRRPEGVTFVLSEKTRYDEDC